MIKFKKDGKLTVFRIAEYLGPARSNNFAEYASCILAVEKCWQLGAATVMGWGDSNLLVRQVEGKWQVQVGLLRGMHRRLCALLNRFDSAKLQHVFRKDNGKADKLANRGTDRGQGIAWRKLQSLPHIEGWIRKDHSGTVEWAWDAPNLPISGGVVQSETVIVGVMSQKELAHFHSGFLVVFEMPTPKWGMAKCWGVLSWLESEYMEVRVQMGVSNLWEVNEWKIRDRTVVARARVFVEAVPAGWIPMTVDQASAGIMRAAAMGGNQE